MTTTTAKADGVKTMGSRESWIKNKVKNIKKKIVALSLSLLANDARTRQTSWAIRENASKNLCCLSSRRLIRLSIATRELRIFMKFFLFFSLFFTRVPFSPLVPPPKSISSTRLVRFLVDDLVGIFFFINNYELIALRPRWRRMANLRPGRRRPGRSAPRGVFYDEITTK